MYTREELKHKKFEECVVVMQRYLHKFIKDKKNFKRLKWHEKDFFFHHLQILKDNKGNKSFDLLNIPEATDFLFEKIIVTYANNGDGDFDFTKNTNDYDGLIKNKLQQKYQNIFWKKLNSWKLTLEQHKGVYDSVIYPMRNTKLKELEGLYYNRKITKQSFIKRRNFVDALFFHIGYITKCYFDELKNKSIHKVVAGFDFYADIFTYCHVMSRHYFPQMNKGIGGTLNDNIPYIDIFELPSSLLRLVSDYAIIGNITDKTEYILFEMDCTKYILWIKYGISSEGTKQFQIRSFYKCTEQRDILKFEGLTKTHIRESLYAYVNNTTNENGNYQEY